MKFAKKKKEKKSMVLQPAAGQWPGALVSILSPLGEHQLLGGANNSRVGRNEKDTAREDQNHESLKGGRKQGSSLLFLGTHLSN